MCDWWDKFVCACVFVLLVFFHSTPFALGANHITLYIVLYMGCPWLPLATNCPRGRSLSVLLPCWCPGCPLGMKNPPFRPQPRVIESFRRSLQPLLQSLERGSVAAERSLAPACGASLCLRRRSLRRRGLHPTAIVCSAKSL